jgi:hypothetical protein
MNHDEGHRWFRRQDPTKQGDLESGKIDNSGGGLIKSAFAIFLERAIKT